MSQRVSCEARRTFWPRRPMARRELVVGHHHLDAAPPRRRARPCVTSAGASAFTTKVGVVVRPGDDVDLLALQLVHDRLHAASRACRRRRRPGRSSCRGEITAIFARRARVAGHRLDLDDAVVDLRHLLREQLGQEAGMRAGQEDLRAARLLAHVVDVGAHAVAVAEGLARDGLVAAQQGLGAAEIDHQVAVLGALDDAVDDLAHAVLVLVELLACARPRARAARSPAWRSARRCGRNRSAAAGRR